MFTTALKVKSSGRKKQKDQTIFKRIDIDKKKRRVVSGVEQGSADAAESDRWKCMLQGLEFDDDVWLSDVVKMIRDMREEFKKEKDTTAKRHAAEALLGLKEAKGKQSCA